MFDYIPMIISEGIIPSLYITLVSTLLAYIIGLPLGIVLVMTDPNGLKPMPMLNRVLNIIVNILRSVPFLILLIAVMPMTRLLVGTTIGDTATIPPLVLASFPFIARLVESSLNEVDTGVIEAMRSMGASNMQIALKAMLPEALPSLISNAATATTTILSFSALAGVVGGGGLGKLAINYGYRRGNSEVMLLTVIALVIIVQIIQAIGNLVARRADKR